MATKGKEYTLAVRIAGKIDKTFNSSLKTANSSLKKTVSNINSSFTSLDQSYNKIINFGKSTIKTVTRAATVASVAVGAAVVAAVNAGREFESAFAGVKKTVEATDEEYAKIRQNILDMSKEIPSTAVEIARVMEVAGQLGIAKEHLVDFTEVMIALGVSTNLSAEEAATALAKFANITNMDSSDFEKLGSVIVDLGNNFATTELDIVEMSTRLAASGELVGLTEAQIMALATSMSSVGIAAETGGSTMSKLLKKMQIATELESDAMHEYASVAGMTGEQFKQTFQKDAVSAMAAFIDGLNDTERNGKSAIVILDEMGLNEIRLSNTILSLANANGLMTEAITMANEAWDENTALSVEAGKRYETMDSKIQIFKNTVTDAGIAVYEELRGPMSEGLDWLTDAVGRFTEYATGPNGISKWINNLKTSLPTVINNAKTFGSTVLNFIEPLLNAGKWLIRHPKFLATAFVSLGTVLATYKIASTVTHITNALIGFFSSPVKLAITGVTALIGGLAGAIYSYKKKQQELIRQNIAKHFGNIRLSLEEIEEVADHLINKNGVLDRLHKAFEAFDELDTIQDSIDNAMSVINKTHWKVNIGMELSEDEIGTYKDSIQEYVNQCQNYIQQNQYALTLAVAVAYDEDDAFGSQLIEEINQFYNDQYGELQSIGTKLNEAITEAFTDGLLDIDEAKEIQELLQQLADIQGAIASSNFDAALTTLGIDYGLASGAQLDADTFKNLQTEVNEQLALFKEENNKSRDKLIQNAALRYNQGYITKEEYDAEVKQIAADFNALYGESLATATQFLLDSIYDTGMIEDTYKELYKMAKEMYPDYDMSEYGVYNVDGLPTYAENPLDNIFYNIMDSSYPMDKVADVMTDSINTLLGAMQPSIDELYKQRDNYIALGKAVPENIAKGISDYETLKELANSPGVIGEAIKYGLEESGKLEELTTLLEGYGYTIDEVIADSIQQNSYIVSDAMQDVIDNTKLQIMADSFMYNPINKIMGGNPLDPLGILPGHADGGIFTVPHIAAFAESGPEAAIPLDGSENAIRLWLRTGLLLGMGSVLDDVDIEGGGSGPHIEYKPTLVFNGGAPSQNDLESAMRTSQEEFEEMMAKYIKDHGRVAFG